MARYIDADKVMEEIERIGGHNLCEWETIGVKALIDRQPTADVAPKSEVEELLTRLNNVYVAIDIAEDDVYRLEKENDELKDTNQHLFEFIAEVKREIARDIFEEIEKEVLLSFPASSYIDAPRTTQNKIWNTIAELKNKYTEEQT